MKHLKRIALVALVGFGFSLLAPQAQAKPGKGNAFGHCKDKRWKKSWGRNSSSRYRTVYRGNRNDNGYTGQRFYLRRIPYRVNGVIRYRTQRVYY